MDACAPQGAPNQLVYIIILELFFSAHDGERAPAAAASEQGRKSARALRRIDPWTRSTDLDVLVCIATDRIPLLKLCSGVLPLHPILSSDLATKTLTPPKATRPAYPAQNETRC